MDVGRSVPPNLLAAVRMAVHVLTGALLRRRMTWGATPEEDSSTGRGDEAIPDPSWTVIHAVTIHAPAERIGPWPAQLGQGRGGLSSFERLQNLMGCRMHDTDRFLPEHQDLSSVPEIRLAPRAALAVVRAEPGRDLVLAASPGSSAAGRRVTGPRGRRVVPRDRLRRIGARGAGRRSGQERRAARSGQPAAPSGGNSPPGS